MAIVIGTASSLTINGIKHLGTYRPEKLRSQLRVTDEYREHLKMLAAKSFPNDEGNYATMTAR